MFGKNGKKIQRLTAMALTLAMLITVPGWEAALGEQRYVATPTDLMPVYAPEEDSAGDEIVLPEEALPEEDEIQPEEAVVPPEAVQAAGDAVPVNTESEGAEPVLPEPEGAETADPSNDGTEGTIPEAPMEQPLSAVQQDAAESGLLNIQVDAAATIVMLLPTEAGEELPEAGEEPSETETASAEAAEAFSGEAAETKELTEAAEEAPATSGAKEGAGKAEAPEKKLKAVSTKASAAGNSGGKSGEAMLQNIIEKAIAASGTLDKRIQVILNQSVTYEGDVTITAGSRTVLDGFELELSAEDAGDSGVEGSGSTVINGNVTIRGIKVIMNSVMIAADKTIKVQNAKEEAGDNADRGGELEYHGVDGVANKLSVEVGKNSSATIVTGGGNDVVKVTTDNGAKSLTLDTGNGADTVTATLSGGDVNIATGADPDTVNVTLSGTGAAKLGNIAVDTGDGVDEITVVNNGQAKSATINAGAGDDTIHVDARANGGALTVNTGLGSDEVDVYKGDHFSYETINYRKNLFETETLAGAGVATVITLQNGDPNAIDRYTLDVWTAGAIKEIALKDGKGASVFLKGDLNLTMLTAGTNPIERIKNGIRLHNETEMAPGSDFTLDVTWDRDAYNFTDALKNKKTVSLYPEKDAETFVYSTDQYGALEDFTDYVFMAPVNGLKTIVFPASKPLLLSNVVMDTALTKDTGAILQADVKEEEDAAKDNAKQDAEAAKQDPDLSNEKTDPPESGDHLIVHDVDVGKMNLLLKGKQIDLKGTIAADNVRAQSVQGTYKMVMELITTLMNEGVSSLVDDLIMINDSASILVGKKADIKTVHDIALLARVKHFGGILTVAPNLNVVNVKVADAGIFISDGAKLTSQKGNVTADSKIETTTGYSIEFKPDGTISQTKSGMALGLNVIWDDAVVNVEKGATVTAAEDIILRADSDVKVINYAESGTAGIPIALALSIINNDVTSSVSGKLDAGHEVFVSATGKVDDDTNASKGAGVSSGINGFIAVSWVQQDVDAVIKKDADVTAGGDIGVYSTNIALAKTVAAAGPEKQPPEEDAFSTAISNIVSTILGPILKPLGNVFGKLGSAVSSGLAAGWNKIRGAKYREKKFQAMLRGLGRETYNIRVVSLDATSASQGSATVKVKRAIVEERLNDIVAILDIQPKEGYKTGSVRYRYLEPGKDKYTYVAVKPNSEGGYAFSLQNLQSLDLEVIVSFVPANEEPKEPSSDRVAEGLPVLREENLEDLASWTDVLNDAKESVGDAEGDDDFVIEGGYAELVTGYNLAINEHAEGGKLLTWQTGEDDESLKKIYSGRTLRFVGNPDAGMQLESVTVEWKDQKAIVTADSQGRFLFNIPEGLEADTKFRAIATFGPKPEEEKAAGMEMTGAIALGVVQNDGRAEIEDETRVSAGGLVELVGVKVTEVENLADGSAVTESTTTAKKEKQKKLGVETRWPVPGADYAVKVVSTLDGDFSVTTDTKDNASATHPKFTLKTETALDQDKTNVRILVSYYTKNTLNYFHQVMTTKEYTKDDLTFNEDGTVTFQPDLGDNAVVEGTTLDVNFVFTNKKGTVLTSGDQSAEKYIVSNPIRISHNTVSVVEGKNVTKVETGDVYFVRKDGTKYYFNPVAETKNGYRIDADGSLDGNTRESNKDALYISWVGADGLTHKAGMKRASGDVYWYFDTADSNNAIPAGAPITVNAVFVEDVRKIEEQKPKDEKGNEIDNGKMTLDTSKAKAGDEVTITLTGKDGYYPALVVIRTAKGMKLEKSEYTPDAKGQVTIKVPAYESDSDYLIISPRFAKKNITLTVTGSSGAKEDTSAKSLKLSESGSAFGGQSITVSPSDDLFALGYKVTGVTATYNGQTLPATGATFTIPADASAGEVKISATLQLKPLEIKSYSDPAGGFHFGIKQAKDLGSVESTTARVEPGETVQLQVKPKQAGYRVKERALRVVVKTKSGQQQIKCTRVSENLYKFIMPSDTDITSVAIEAEFEKGSDAPAWSLGAAIAVGVTLDENKVQISGGQIEAGQGVSLTAVSAGKSTTDALAGFSSGDIGVAGALSVQVANARTRAVIQQSDSGSITIPNGSIFLLGKADQSFGVTADASGREGAKAKKTGVGAGIAVAVNLLSTRAEIEDGVKLGRKQTAEEAAAGTLPPLTRLQSISISAKNKINDTLAARAGAAGGTSIVPVAAVNVSNTSARANLGKLNLDNGKVRFSGKTDKDLTETEKLLKAGVLPVAGKTTVQADSRSNLKQYNHLLEADAASSGDSTAIGAAIIVSWAKNSVESTLNQSLKTGDDISVTASSGDALKAVAKASAEGGEPGDKDASGQGSADKQADKMLGGAGGLAGKYGDGADVKNDISGRQQAETAEGSVAGAGALVVNIQKNRASSEVSDGTNLITAGKLTVTTENRMEADAIANSSATASDTGVGVGIAINIATMENTARIGTGLVQAAELELAARIAEAPSKMRTVTIVEDASNFKTQMNESIKDMIRSLLGEKDYAKVEPFLSPYETFFATFFDKLVQDLNLGQLLNIISDDTGSSFKNAGNLLWERLKAFPKALAEPLRVVYEEAVGTVTGWSEERFERLVDDLWNTATTQLFGNAMQAGRQFIREGYKQVAASVISIINDKISGKGFDKKLFKETLQNAVKDLLKDVLKRTLNSLVKQLNSELGIVTDNNIALVTRLTKTSMTELEKEFLPYVTKIFREQVYDYEPILTKIQEKGFTDFVKDELRSLFKEACVAFTNEALDKLVGGLDVKIQRKPTADRHIITTQAISGAGAKGNTGAGSVALAVVNLDTKATIAASDETISVTGDMILEAEELRRIRTHATAAVDAMGEADNNIGAGDTEDSQTTGTDAGQTTIKENNITVTTGFGGRASFSTVDENEIYLYTDPGYTLEGATVTRSYTKIDGTEVIESIPVEKYGDDWAIQPTYGLSWDALDDEEKEQANLTIDVTFEDRLITLPKAEQVGWKNADRIQIDVQGREKAEGEQAKAKLGDLVEIAIPKPDDDKTVIRYVTIFGKDEMEIASNVGDTNDPPTDLVVLLSENDVEAVYGFRMPDEEIGRIEVIYAAKHPDEENLKKSKTQATDRAGRSVGVGLSFAITYGNSDVKTEIGKRGVGAKDVYDITAGTLAMTASSDHEEENFSTAGTDPFEGTNGDAKDMGIDGSVAVNILDNDVRASIAAGTRVKTTATEREMEAPPEKEVADDEPEAIEITAGSVIVSATEISENETKASAFATGSTTAVGASVAVNISLSDVLAKLGAKTEAKGKAVVRGHSLSRDVTWSFASALGADVQRNLNKFAKGAKATEDAANSLTTGEYFNEKAKDENEKKKSTDTSKRITNRLNDDRVKNAEGSEASSNLPVSSNVARSQNAQSESGEEADAEGGNASGIIQKQSGISAPIQGGGQTKKKLQVAATVGVTVTNHKAQVTVDNPVQAGGDIELIAKTAGNFNTRSTAASMTTAEGPGKTIAAAIGVSVNKNKALVDVTGDLTSERGDVTVDADLKQNMTDEFRGKLAVQALAGAVSGKGQSFSIAGAVSVVDSRAETRATVDATKIEGNDVTVRANDKSKLALRAGGFNVAKGASVGAGLSAAAINSKNNVKASVADGATIKADAFHLIARKEAVTFKDFKFPLSWANLITDSSELDDEERANVTTGLVDIHRKPGEKSYTVDVNVNAYALMNFVDALNFLSSNNYYTESVAGSFISGSANRTKPNAANLAGSVSVVRVKNQIEALLGNRVTIQKRHDDAEGSDNTVEILASGDNNARLLGGAVAAGKAKKSAGITVTYLKNEDVVTATSGDGLNITSGDMSQKAEADTSVQTFNAAAAVSTESEADGTLGGAANVLILKNKALNTVGQGATVTAKDIDISSGADMGLILVSVSASGAKHGAAAGGTLAYVNDEAIATTTIGDEHALTATDGDVSITADATDKVISVIASASGAAQGTAVAGAINVLRSATKGLVTLGQGGAEKGIFAARDAILRGETESRVINVTVSAAGSKGKAVGLSANVNVFERNSGVSAEGGAAYRINAGRDVMISGYGKNLSVLPALAVAGGKEFSLTGNIPVIVSENTVNTTLGAGTITADGEAAIASRLRDQTYAISGTVAVSISSAAVGAIAMTIVRNNTVKTDLGDTGVSAAGGAGTLAGKLPGGAPEFKGLYVGATVKDTLIAAAAGVAVAGTTGVTANILTAVNKNTVTTDANHATLTAAEGGEGSATVEANNDSNLVTLAGGVSAGLTNAVGATIVVVVSSKKVKAETSLLSADQDVNVRAKNKDHYFGLSLSAGGSGKTAVELGISVQNMKSTALAHAHGSMTAGQGSVNIASENNTDVEHVAAALAGSAKTAVTPEVVVSNFVGSSEAIVDPDLVVNAAKGVNVTARSDKDLDHYTIGVAAAGKAAVSGAVTVVLLKDKTRARLLSGTTVDAETMTISSGANVDLTGASGLVAAAVGAGVGVNAIVSVARGEVLSDFRGDATLSGKATVEAESDRDLVNMAATIASGAAGVGINVMALVAGAHMDQDAANMLAGEGDDQTLDTDSLMDYMDDNGVDTADLKEQRDKDGNLIHTGMDDDLSGNGTNNKDMNIGDGKNMDAASGYKDDSLYDANNGDQGENAEFDDDSESDDINQAKTLGASKTDITEDPNAMVPGRQNAVSATVAEGSSITASDVDVTAKEQTKADLFGASVASGNMAGVGVGFSIALLHSNVVAESAGTLTLTGGKVNIFARSQSGDVAAGEIDGEEERTSAIQKLLDKQDVIPARRSIRVLSLVAGGSGTASEGVAVAGAVARADSVTQATLGGVITGASEVNVMGQMLYDNVCALNLAIAGAMGGAVAGSVAVGTSEGHLGAKLHRSARIYGESTAINVNTVSVMKATAVSASAAVAASGVPLPTGTAVAAGVAVASNRMKQNTIVEQGALANLTGEQGSLNVLGKSDTKSNSYLLAVALSNAGAAGSMGIAVSIVKPTVKTTVGAEGRENTYLDLGTMDAVNIENDVTSKAKADLISIAVGGGSLSGNALVLFNDTDATVKAANLKGTYGSLSLKGNLDTKGESLLAAASIAGMTSVGLSVSYVDVHSRNDVLLDTDRMTATILGALTVTAGDDDRTTEAKATSLSAGAGLTALSLNTAIARNRAVNNAAITGKRGLNAQTIILKAGGGGSAYSDLYGLSLGEVSIAGSIDIALNEATSIATLNLSRGAVNGDLTVSSSATGETKAKMLTGSGSLIGVTANVAVTYGRTRSLVDVNLPQAPAKAISLSATNTGKDKVSTLIDNQSFGGLTVAALLGFAYSQDVFDTRVTLNGENWNLKNPVVLTTYDAETEAIVTPSSMGVSANLMKVAVNLAKAKGASYAGAQLTVANGSLSTENDVDVKAVGVTEVTSHIRPAVLELALINLCANVALADLSTVQAAVLKLDSGKITQAGAVNVESITNRARTNAVAGASGRNSLTDEEEEQININAGEATLNYATAGENLESTATILGGGRENNTISANTLLVQATTGKDTDDDGRIIDTWTQAYASTRSPAGFSLLLSVGGLVAESTSKDAFNVLVKGVNATVTGPVTLKAIGKSRSDALGGAPGKIGAVVVSISEMEANLGSKKDRQTVKVIIDKNTTITTEGNMTIEAQNQGYAGTEMGSKTLFSLGSVSTATIPTDSWYDTGVTIGRGAILSSTGTMDVTSRTDSGAKSSVDATSLGLAFDVGVMKGSNTLNEKNSIQIGKSASLTSGGDLNLKTVSNADAQAKSFYKGGGVFAGEFGTADNTIERDVRLNVGDSAVLTSTGGNLVLNSLVGEADKITTETRVKGGGAFVIGRAKAYTKVTTYNELKIGRGTTLAASEALKLLARSTSHREGNLRGTSDKADTYGIYTTAEANGGGLLVNPQSTSSTTLNITTYVDINQDGDKPLIDPDDDEVELEDDVPDDEPLEDDPRQEQQENAENPENPENPENNENNENTEEQDGNDEVMYALAEGHGSDPAMNADIINNSTILRGRTVTVMIDNGGLSAGGYSDAEGSAVFGWSKASTSLTVNLMNTIWVDRTDFDTKAGTTLLVANDGTNNDKPLVFSKSKAKMKAIGTAKSSASTAGQLYNQIRTTDGRQITHLGAFTHIARDPNTSLVNTRTAPFETKEAEDEEDTEGKDVGGDSFDPNTIAWTAAKWRCDFCGEGNGVNVLRPDAWNLDDELENSLTKALNPLTTLESMVQMVQNATKARYMREETNTIGSLFVLAVESILENDVRLEKGKLNRYLMWTNKPLQEKVFMLPNATRLITTSGGNLLMVSDVFSGNVTDDGKTQFIDLIVGLTGNLIKNPAIPVGMDGEMDFAGGVFTIPQQTDMELYLHEVSGAWLQAQFADTTFRLLSADQEALNECATGEGNHPDGTILEGLTKAETADGWTCYWVGRTPEEAADDETLVYLLINDTTDEVDAFRTTKAAMAAGQEAMDVSLYLYRDSESDRKEIEKYNAIFFDTPEGYDSLVKLITDVEPGRTIEVPRPLRITLRAFQLKQTEPPAYFIRGIMFILADGTKGVVDLFDGAYHATFDGDTFESDYIRIEGIQSKDYAVTIKKKQPVWPEWIDASTAEDAEGRVYKLVDGQWVEGTNS